MEIEHYQLELRYQELRVVEPARHARLLASLAEHGQQSAVLVVSTGDDQYVLVDGYARVAALRALGRNVVEAVVLDLPETDALILAWRLELRHRRSALEEGWLVAALLELHLTQREVAHRLQRSTSWVSRRLALTQQLPASTQAAVKAGLVPPQAAMRYLVTLARGNAEHCERLVAALGRVPVSVRQMERLYVGYKRGDEGVREQIVSQPWLFLKADAAVQPAPRLPADDPAAPLLEDLRSIVASVRRAQRRVSEGVLRELDARRRAIVYRARHEVQAVFESLMDHLTEESPCSTSTPAPRS